MILASNAFALQPGQERFVFHIKKLGVKVGEATLSFNGLVKYENHSYIEIVFTVNALNFYDEERIFMDLQTEYPVMVLRDLDLWGKKEKIKEVYNFDEHKVIVTKEAKGEVTKQEIQKKERIDNIYCFIYRFRKGGDFKIGTSVAMNLPTKNVKMDVLKKMTISAVGDKHEAYLLQSDPKEYRVWLGTDDKHLPLRIDGSMGLASTSMILATYEMQ